MQQADCALEFPQRKTRATSADGATDKRLY